MSSPLAIGAVSAVLRNLLDNGIVDGGPAVGSVKVTAVAPDTIKLDDPDAGPSLNLFLYRVSPNPGWRNAGLPALRRRTARGPRTRRSRSTCTTCSPPTARPTSRPRSCSATRCRSSTNAPCSTARRSARRCRPEPARAAAILPPAFQALAASDLADQVEAITVTPRADRHRGDVAAVVGDPGALPAERRLPRVGRAHRGDQARAQRSAGAHAR